MYPQSLNELQKFLAACTFAGQDANGLYFAVGGDRWDEWNIAPYWNEDGVAGVLAVHYRDGFTADGVPTRALVESFFIPVSGVNNTDALADALGV